MASVATGDQSIAGGFIAVLKKDKVTPLSREICLQLCLAAVYLEAEKLQCVSKIPRSVYTCFDARCIGTGKSNDHSKAGARGWS